MENEKLCVQCGNAVEEDRYCYALPTCHACLPPPEPLSIVPVRVNKEGLTFDEWFDAANAFDPQAVDIDIAAQAWLRGDDPTEYAARAEKEDITCHQQLQGS